MNGLCENCQVYFPMPDDFGQGVPYKCPHCQSLLVPYDVDFDDVDTEQQPAQSGDSETVEQDQQQLSAEEDRDSRKEAEDPPSVDKGESGAAKEDLDDTLLLEDLDIIEEISEDPDIIEETGEKEETDESLESVEDDKPGEADSGADLPIDIMLGWDMEQSPSQSGDKEESASALEPDQPFRSSSVRSDKNAGKIEETGKKPPVPPKLPPGFPSSAKPSSSSDQAADILWFYPHPCTRVETARAERDAKEKAGKKIQESEKPTKIVAPPSAPKSPVEELSEDLSGLKPPTVENLEKEDISSAQTQEVLKPEFSQDKKEGVIAAGDTSKEKAKKEISENKKSKPVSKKEKSAGQEEKRKPEKKGFSGGMAAAAAVVLMLGAGTAWWATGMPGLDTSSADPTLKTERKKADPPKAVAVERAEIKKSEAAKKDAEEIAVPAEEETVEIDEAETDLEEDGELEAEGALEEGAEEIGISDDVEDEIPEPEARQDDTVERDSPPAVKTAKTARPEPVRTKRPVERKSPPTQKAEQPRTPPPTKKAAPPPTKKAAPPPAEEPVAEAPETPTPQEMAREFVGAGNRNAREGNIQEAIEQYRRAVEINSREWRAFLGLGISYARLERNEESAQSYETFLRLAPQNHPMREDVQEIVDQYRERQ